ncbi:amyloid beta A4 precursor protein-binding family B member 1-interacting protein-like isoform X3 [Xiphias gladius]|uniref:amyloid beta A4 precursor protein-binding family B member 1-interacting protein-like isoform X3 n=1 Tax=Xiphias gladius TaxID=8245 RepID=UPI001A98FECF|nr:amyloid beta A4 precursor protein-binding family B member 1-interacting protein-like isoform X3 [Xiphias gladius]
MCGLFVGTVSCSYLRSRLSWCFPWTFESETILQRSCGLREQTFGVRAKGATSSHPLLAGTPRVSGGLGVPAKNHLQPDSMRKMSRKTAAVRLQGGPTQPPFSLTLASPPPAVVSQRPPGHPALPPPPAPPPQESPQTAAKYLHRFFPSLRRGKRPLAASPSLPPQASEIPEIPDRGRRLSAPL